MSSQLAAATIANLLENTLGFSHALAEPAGFDQKRWFWRHRYFQRQGWDNGNIQWTFSVASSLVNRR